ncbi:MAG: PilZ domain-containing protein [Syntrophobacterales bacterium]|nr:PilZ domain-containing protein [Syntrophobacterales bacterium]
MDINKGTQSEIKPGKVDVKFVSGGETVRTEGYIKSSSVEAIVIRLDTNDKKMTLPVGTDIYVSKEDIHYSVIDSKDFPEVKAVRLSRREHVRVDDILKVDYRKISQEDYERCEGNPEIIFKNTFGEPLKTPEIEEADSELLYKLIYQANLKIDRILNILESRDTERYVSAGSEGVNISGAGMRFVANRSFSIGDIIALRVFLPLTHGTCVTVLGKVTSSEESGPGNRYNVSVRFVELSESDREIIVRYVFKRQRELLRLGSERKSRESESVDGEKARG